MRDCQFLHCFVVVTFVPKITLFGRPLQQPCCSINVLILSLIKPILSLIKPRSPVPSHPRLCLGCRVLRMHGGALRCHHWDHRPHQWQGKAGRCWCRGLQLASGTEQSVCILFKQVSYENPLCSACDLSELILDVCGDGLCETRCRGLCPRFRLRGTGRLECLSR